MAIYYPDGSNSTTGRQIQVVMATDTTYRSAGEGTSILAVQCSITPSDSNNNILIQTHFTCHGPAEDWIIKLERSVGGSDTVIGNSDNGTVNRNGLVGGSSRGGGWEMKNHSVVYLDSPGTTSTVTYSIYPRFTGGSGTIGVNRTQNSTGSDSDGTRAVMVLTEVAV
tara:strand:- start:231 stop:731 length:501 start_codon:yes stop_codon:yes gene_type:complete